MISLHSPYRPAWDAFRQGRYVLCVSNEIITEYTEVLTQLTTPYIAENIVHIAEGRFFCYNERTVPVLRAFFSYLPSFLRLFCHFSPKK